MNSVKDQNIITNSLSKNFQPLEVIHHVSNIKQVELLDNGNLEYLIQTYVNHGLDNHYCYINSQEDLNRYYEDAYETIVSELTEQFLEVCDWGVEEGESENSKNIEIAETAMYDECANYVHDSLNILELIRDDLDVFLMSKPARFLIGKNVLKCDIYRDNAVLYKMR